MDTNESSTDIPSTVVKTSKPSETSKKRSVYNIRRENPQQQNEKTTRNTSMYNNVNSTKAPRLQDDKTKPFKEEQNMVSVEKLSAAFREQELLGEISKLQGLIKQVRLKTLHESVNHLRNSQYQEQLENNVIQKSSTFTRKKQESKILKKARRVASTSNDLEMALENHINQIIRGGELQMPNHADKLLIYNFECNIDGFAKSCVQAGIGRIIEAKIKVNPKNYHHASIILESGIEARITSLAARMYSLDGDIVKAFVRNAGDGYSHNSSNSDTSGFIEDLDIIKRDDDTEYSLDVRILKETNVNNFSHLWRYAFVTNVVRQCGNRVFIGTINFGKVFKINTNNYYKFRARDTKLPDVYIPSTESHDLENHVDYLYIAEITNVEKDGRFFGELKKEIGVSQRISDEIQTILIHNHLNDLPNYENIPEEFVNVPLRITENDLLHRDDLRDECIFTIHSPSAVYLSDAISCKPMQKQGFYEIGIHIADVSHFIQENSQIDHIARKRAESVYLINYMINMLPDALCHRCSLYPDEEKLTFSIFWVMNEKARIVSTRFAKSIIRSCCRLCYEDAEKVINFPNRVFNGNDLPTVCNGFRLADICVRVRTLNSIAEILRRRRFDNGSLYIEKPKFAFEIDNFTGEPISCQLVEKKSSQYMLEEFIIQANQSVAQFIYKRLPDISFLRRQAPPQPCGIKKLKAALALANIVMDMSNSKSIQKSRDRICLESHKPEVMLAGLNYLLSIPMQSAKYFCGGAVTTSDEMYNYCLALPIYAHFTNPIRRYADVMLHRLLSAAIDFSPIPTHSIRELNEIAETCNVQKLNAKNAAEDCARFYFEHYVDIKKSINVRAVIIRIFKNSMEVLIMESGHLLTIAYNSQSVVIDSSNAPLMITVAEKNSIKPPQELRIFSVVKLKLNVWNHKIVGFLFSPDKDQSIKNAIESSKVKCACSDAKLNKPQSSGSKKRYVPKIIQKKARPIKKRNQQSKVQEQLPENESECYKVEDG